LCDRVIVRLRDELIEKTGFMISAGDCQSLNDSITQ